MGKKQTNIPWRDRSSSSISANRSRKCASCKYRGVLGGGKIFCNYIFITKRMRRSDPFACKRYEKGEMIREETVQDYETAEDVEGIETVEAMEQGAEE